MSAQAQPAYDPEHARARIYAFQRGLRTMDGVAVDDDCWRGRELVAILADTSSEDGPTRKLTLDEAADVLRFMFMSEPFDPKNFYRERAGKPSVSCGQMFVLMAVYKAIVAALDDAGGDA